MFTVFLALYLFNWESILPALTVPLDHWYLGLAVYIIEVIAVIALGKNAYRHKILLHLTFIALAIFLQDIPDMLTLLGLTVY